MTVGRVSTLYRLSTCTLLLLTQGNLAETRAALEKLLPRALEAWEVPEFFRRGLCSCVQLCVAINV